MSAEGRIGQVAASLLQTDLSDGLVARKEYSEDGRGSCCRDTEPIPRRLIQIFRQRTPGRGSDVVLKMRRIRGSDNGGGHVRIGDREAQHEFHRCHAIE